ncbi:YIP1 family protein [Streptomyces sp. AJS327]|uniref:Yip1 family protein n=1 Tax=Streptomyces sp. AJS327 TaxID=2545265 RepID=UPI0017F52DD2|nr:Yip1 family protein [Streptomyces sp. AJS327]MBA0052976.1 YIP1 family protein [Streptomyces sp. AJS327]
MAGFRMGRGRDARGAGRQGGSPQQGTYGQPPYGQQQPPYGTQGGAQQWPQAGGHAGPGGRSEPEYLGGHQPGPGPRPGGDPFANAPGHTQQFSVHDPYGHDPQGRDPYGQDPYGYGPGDGYSAGSTYGAGTPGPPSGPRLSRKDLLRGLVLRPNATFWQMRDYPVWGPALIVTFLYGLLAIFGLDQGRDDVLGATLSTAIPFVISTAVAVVFAGLVLGAVTHTLARQFGGDGAWAPTIGLSMLIMSMTDAPRLLFALFLGGTAPLVQVLGWATWIAAGFLFTSMVSRSHDLPWPRALGASAVQLLALLALVKLGTL